MTGDVGVRTGSSPAARAYDASMDLGEVVAIGLAGLAAGAINTVVGSGTLITFPVLLAFGYSPVTANVSNTIGLVPGSVSGAIGYRRELEGQRRRVLRLGTASLLGGTTGAVLLLVLPASAFKAIVPVFIAIALVLVVLQPRLNRMLAERQISKRERGRAVDAARRLRRPASTAATSAPPRGSCCSACSGSRCRRTCSARTRSRTCSPRSSTASPAIYFVFAAHVEWAPAAIIAGASIVGGQLGAHYGRRLHPAVLRGVIVVVGVSAIVRLLAT